MTRVTPSSIDEAQAWVRARLTAQQPFAIRGHHRRFHPQGATPPEAELSLSALTATNFFDPDDMVVGVEAGMTVQALQTLLGERNMLLPVNPWFPDSSIGGLLASNDIGPNRMNMGGLRDCIIGIEYLNGEGERVHAGGTVVKNVTGYDLNRMMIGSLGGLGVITSANFKVMPRPVAPHALYGRFSDSSWLHHVGDLHRARLPLDWVQALSPATSGSSEWGLGIGFSGNADRRQRLQQEIQSRFPAPLQLLADGETDPDFPVLPGTDRHTGWVASLRKHWALPDGHLHVMLLLPTAEALNPMHLTSLPQEGLHVVAHPIGADLHFFLKASEPGAQRQLLAALKSVARRVQGQLVWGSAHPDLTYTDLEERAQAPGYSLAKRLKQHLDPSGVFHAPFYEL